MGRLALIIMRRMSIQAAEAVAHPPWVVQEQADIMSRQDMQQQPILALVVAVAQAVI